MSGIIDEHITTPFTLGGEQADEILRNLSTTFGAFFYFVTSKKLVNEKKNLETFRFIKFLGPRGPYWAFSITVFFLVYTAHYSVRL